MFRARSGVKGSIGSNPSKRPKNNDTPLPNGKLPPVLQVTGDTEDAVVNQSTTEYDIVYVGRHDPTMKEEALNDYISPWLRQILSTTKIGFVNWDSYNGNTPWHKKGARRISRLECGLPFRRKGSFHYCPKGCGRMLEALVHQVFIELGQQVENLLSTEVRLQFTTHYRCLFAHCNSSKHSSNRRYLTSRQSKER